jgi:serine protease Do
MTSNTEQLVAELAAMAETLRCSTVQIRGQRGEIGSGVIWQADGVIVTNAHVVHRSKAEVELFDGHRLPATLTAHSPQRDLAVLQVDATDLPAARIGNSDNLRVGELVLAMGNPLGLRGALTTGVVHAVSLTGSHRNWIQADVPLAPGNSGGPLATAQGEVIGINTMIVEGRGFAVASNIVQRFLQAPAEHPYLGVTLQPVRIPLEGRRRFGLLIMPVEADSSAAIAQLQVGDVLVGVRGCYFQTPDELFHILANSNVGDGLPLVVLRGSQRIVVDVVLCSKISPPQAA